MLPVLCRTTIVSTTTLPPGARTLVTEATTASRRTGVTKVDRTDAASSPCASESSVHSPTPASPRAMANRNFAPIDAASSKWTSRQVRSAAFQYRNHDPSGVTCRTIDGCASRKASADSKVTLRTPP